MKSLVDASVRESVAQRVRRLKADTKPLWGRMSSHQMLCHLTDSFKTGTGEKKVGSRSFLLPGPLMKWIALYVPAPWPKGAPTMPEVDQCIGGTRPVDFERDRQELLRVIDDFCTRAPQQLAPSHPLFGRMKHGEWLRWGYLHANHHLKQFRV